MGKKCEHLQSKWTWDSVNDRPFVRHCEDCGERLSLGPANDEPVEVKIEISAATAADGDAAWDSWEQREELGTVSAFPWDPTRPLAEQWPWNADVDPPGYVTPVASEETLQPFRDALAREARDAAGDAALAEPGYLTPLASQFDTSDCEPDPPAGEMFDADGVSLEDRLADAINAVLSPAESTPIARIESALARLGSEHEPAEGWEDRVLKEVK